MSYTSCIKIPATKIDTSPEKNHINSRDNDQASIVYYELISIANEVFGHGNWSHSVTSQTIDFVEYVMGKYHIGCAAYVRVQLNNGTFHEDMGYSNAENSVKGLAIKSAREVSITTALKKVLICFDKEIELKILNINTNQKQKIQNSAISTIENNKNIDKSLSRSNSAPIKVIETTEKMDIVVTKDVMKKEVIDKKNLPISKTVTTTVNNQVPSVSTSNDNLITSATLSEEELQRLERKRRQKQKQEEYKRQMLEKTNNEKKIKN